MLPIFEDYLFAQGYFVDEDDDVAEYDEGQEEMPVATLVALWHYAWIRITARPELASPHMLRVAQRNLGLSVPEPFYQGFPATVRASESAERLLDQLLHYFRTYYLGDFSRAGHSVFEARYERLAFVEKVTPKEIAIITQAESEELLERATEGFLASTRPLNETNQELVTAFLNTHPTYSVERCACKDTAVRLILDTGSLDLVRHIELSDVIRMLEWLHEMRYQDLKAVYSKSRVGPSVVKYVPVSQMKKLSLRNRDRKLITAVLDRIFERGNVDIDSCLEKKRIWNGLLHHLHYRPKCVEAKEFCTAIRGKDRRSVYSAMECCLAAGDVRGATDALLAGKGPGAILRHLDHLLSRIDTSREPDRVEEDITYVFGACNSRNRIILVQLLLKYGARAYLPSGEKERDFTFVHLGQLRKHHETDKERARRRSALSVEMSQRVEAWLRDQLARACSGSLGKVYVDDALRYAAVPLQEGASMSGFGTLPRGTRIPLPEGKKVRAFTYWKKVDDIDLSCFALYDDGGTREFSWRTMAGTISDAPVFSGDQTSGYHGGSEYFDVELLALAKEGGPKCHYLVFCNNVYSWGTFDGCVCRAGYMLRDIDDSGKVFEPATVQSAFVVNCASRAAYLFALDLQDPAFIWLNLGERSMQNVAGMGDVEFLLKYLHITDVFSVRDLAMLLASEVVATPEEADAVFADASAEELGLREGQELIRPRDTARLLELLNG